MPLSTIREFNLDELPSAEVYGLHSQEFKMLSQIYNRKSLNIKSFLGTKKQSLIHNFTSLLKNELLFPYLSLKNLGFQDKILIILPNVKKEHNEKVLRIFSFFNKCHIYEIEGAVLKQKTLRSFKCKFLNFIRDSNLAFPLLIIIIEFKIH